MEYFDADAVPIEDGDGEVVPSDRKPMEMGELAALLAGEIENARETDRTTYKNDRQRALEYYQGRMPDTPAPEKRSAAMSRDVADTVDWMLPGLMRIFFSGDKIVDYMPSEKGDEAFSDQATEYVNYLFLNRCDGYGILWDAFWDALVMRVGIVKFWWDDTPEYMTETYTGLSDDGLAAVTQPDERGEAPEVIEQETAEYQSDDGEPFIEHNVVVRRVKRNGSIRIESVPPEEFLINSDAKSIEDARFLAHRTTKTRTDLILEGFPREKVEDLPTYNDSETEEEAVARSEEFVFGGTGAAAIADKAMEEIQVYECYAKVDMDGDGVAEWTRCILAGGTGEENILAAEPWGDPIPFADVVPARIPHRWQGRSIADQTIDIQQIKTVLFRNSLDNIYENTNRQRVVDERQVANMDDVVSPTFGGIIRSRGGLEVVKWDNPPVLAPQLFQMMSYLDDMIEKRTGVSRATGALDPEALQNQTATATQLGQDNRYSKIELVARNFAEGGLKRLFGGILKLVVAHQDRPEIIRLRDEFVEMDPRGWNADMDVSVNIGLGAGSRDRDMGMLQMILSYQEKILGAFGPTNPFVTVQHLYNTLDKIVSTAGLKHTEQYFQPLSPEEVQQYAQAQQGQPDPKQQAEMQKMSAEMQMMQAKMQADLQMKQQEMAAEREMKVQQMQAEMEMKRADNAAMMEIKREELQLQHQARMEELRMEANLKAVKMQYDMPSVAPTDVPQAEQ